MSIIIEIKTESDNKIVDKDEYELIMKEAEKDQQHLVQELSEKEEVEGIDFEENDIIEGDASEEEEDDNLEDIEIEDPRKILVQKYVNQEI